MTTLQFVFAACLFLIQGVYSQTPANRTTSYTAPESSGVYSQTETPPPIDPAWATEEFRCGIWTGLVFNVKYYQGAYGADTKLGCAYFYFRDILSFVYFVILVYMVVMFLLGYMPAYFKYIRISLNGLLRCFTCNSMGINSSGNDVDCSALFLFFILAATLILFLPEVALLYHVIFDLYLLGGSKFADCGSCGSGCCPSDVQVLCCLPGEKAPAQNGQPLAPDASSQQQPLVTPATPPVSMFHDPLNLRPRIQYVTKYKPVPMGPSIA